MPLPHPPRPTLPRPGSLPPSSISHTRRMRRREREKKKDESDLPKLQCSSAHLSAGDREQQDVGFPRPSFSAQSSITAIPARERYGAQRGGGDIKAPCPQLPDGSLAEEVINSSPSPFPWRQHGDRGDIQLPEGSSRAPSSSTTEQCYFVNSFPLLVCPAPPCPCTSTVPGGLWEQDPPDGQ